MISMVLDADSRPEMQQDACKMGGNAALFYKRT
jgi:hypothetical protein